MKKKRWPVIFLVLVSIFLLAPLFVTLIYSFATSWTEIIPNGWTVAHYKTVLTMEAFWPSLFRGIIISVPAILISGIVIILTMFASVLYFPWVDKIVQSVCMLPHTLKGVILALGVLALYAGADGILGNRILMLIFVYCISIFPYVYQGIRNNLEAINIKQLVEAAEILGASKLYAFIRVVVPNMISGMLVSALLSMSIIFSDYAIVKIIAGSRYLTSQQLLYNSRFLPGQQASVMILFLFAMILLISGVSYYLKSKKEREVQIVVEENE